MSDAGVRFDGEPAITLRTMTDADLAQMCADVAEIKTHVAHLVEVLSRYEHILGRFPAKPTGVLSRFLQ